MAEALTIIPIVTGIISAFGWGIKAFRTWKKHRKENQEQREAQEHLEESQQMVRRDYESKHKALGPRFARGDGKC